jgi:hypothetical protein
LLGAVAAVVLAGVRAPVLRAYTLRISVSKSTITRPLPDDFLGLALEYNTIPRWMGTGLPRNQVLVQLIRNLDPLGSPVLRIGGQSTDRTWWPVPGMSRPPGLTYNLTPAWTAAARTLAQATDAKLLLGLNLEADRPRIDQVEATQLVKGIGRSDIEAFEIGNEPDLYSLVPWYRRLDGRDLPWYSHQGTPVYARGPGYGPSEFAAEFTQALNVVPAIPVAGPETGTPAWLNAFLPLVSSRSRVRMLTSHAYGLDQCVTDPSSRAYPSVPHLLSLFASRDAAGDIAPYVSQAHAKGATYRVDEVGSISCNGRAGVSDTMASALWALDALFSIADENVDGVNLHTYPDSLNGLFDLDLAQGQWQAEVHPLYYGALMFAQAAPAGSRLLALDTSSQDQLRSWATLGPDHRVRVLLINDSLKRTAHAVVHAPAGWQSGAGSVEPLAASSAYATKGITLGGQSFGATTATGILSAPVLQAVEPDHGTYNVTLRASTAALLTLAPKGAALARR